MSGIQEILVIVLLIVALLVIPRMIGKNRRSSAPLPSRRPVTGTVRLAILASFAWPVAAALYFKPWSHGWLLFATWGIAPVLAIWGFAWVVRGYRHRQ